MESTTRETLAQFFAENWLLVAENDYDTYRSMLEIEGEDVASISDELREEWESMVEQVVELVESEVSPLAGLFISRLVQGWGSYPFDLIARRVLELKEGK